MLVTQQAVRAYSSSAYTDEQQTPRLDPLNGQPITIDPYPLAGHTGRAKVVLGAPVPSIAEANRVRLALGMSLLDVLTGGQALDTDVDS